MKNDNALIVNAGRGLAEELIQAAVGTAQSTEQMNHHISVLSIAAISILATEVYNRTRQRGEDAEAVLARFITALRDEYDEMDTGIAEIRSFEINGGRGEFDS